MSGWDDILAQASEPRAARTRGCGRLDYEVEREICRKWQSFTNQQRNKKLLAASYGISTRTLTRILERGGLKAGIDRTIKWKTCTWCGQEFGQKKPPMDQPYRNRHKYRKTCSDECSLKRMQQSVLSAEQQAAREAFVLAACREGKPNHVIARLIGISLEALKKWLKNRPEVKSAMFRIRWVLGDKKRAAKKAERALIREMNGPNA